MSTWVTEKVNRLVVHLAECWVRMLVTVMEKWLEVYWVQWWVSAWVIEKEKWLAVHWAVC